MDFVPYPSGPKEKGSMIQALRLIGETAWSKAYECALDFNKKKEKERVGAVSTKGRK